MKIKLSCLTIALTISIAACNSGGGSSSKKAPTIEPQQEDVVKLLSYCSDELAEPARFPETRSYAITNVNLISMVNDEVITDQTIITQQDEIIWIGHQSEANIADEATIIDGTGKYLIPGLSDMHVHRSSRDEMPVYVANGITSVRNLFGFPGHLKIREESARGYILGPRLYTSGPIIDGATPTWPDGDSVTSASQAIDVATRQYENGYDYLKVYNGLTLEVYRSIIDEGIELNMPVVGHVPADVGLDTVLNSKQKSIEHLSGMGAKLGANNDWDWTNLNRSDIALLTNQLQQYPETYHVPTLVILEKFAYDKHQLDDYYNRQEIQYFCHNFTNSEGFKKLASSIRGSTGSEILKAKNNYDTKMFLVSEMIKRGINLVAGSDVGNPLLLPAYSLIEELLIFEQAGMTPFQSLQTATVNAAKMLRVFETAGTIEVGKNADMVLLPSNPFTDLKAIKTNEGVMIRGVWFNREDLDKRMANLAEHFKTAQ